jgi:UDP-N-acetylglucosamine/UDP-N-acetyl-alpha-D-glucosaminouronate 4-epimerase
MGGTLAAITGGAGFIGSHLAEGFVRKGYAVRVLDNLTTGSMNNLVRVKNDIEYRKLDIRDLEALTEAFRGVSIVLHHAGLSSVPRSVADLPYTHDVNVTGTFNVFTAAVRAGVSKVINASSSSIYGNNSAHPQAETAFPAPLSPYGFSKWMGELYGLQFAKNAKNASLEVVSLRYFNVFGPRSNLDSGYAAVIPLFVRKLAEGNRPIIFGDGTQTRDFTFIDNIIEASLRLAEISVPSGTILNIASGIQTSLNDLVKTLNEIFGSQLKPFYEPERAADIKHSIADIALSRKLLGEYNLRDFRDGLVQTARWFLEVTGRTRRCE